MAERLRTFTEKAGADKKEVHFIPDAAVNDFIALLNVASCLVGNSSAGIKECSYLGTPVVNIGVRQEGRLHAENVTHADYQRDNILAAVQRQIAHGAYPPSQLYHREGANHPTLQLLAPPP